MVDLCCDVNYGCNLYIYLIKSKCKNGIIRCKKERFYICFEIEIQYDWLLSVCMLDFIKPQCGRPTNNN